MIRTLFLAALAMPLAAFAAGQQANEPSPRFAAEPAKLKGAIAVSELVDEEIKTGTGEEFGEVEEIVLDGKGRVVYFAVEPEMDVYEDFAELMNEDEDPQPEPAAGAAERGDARYFSADDEALRIDPRNIQVDQSGDLVIDKLDRRVIFQQSLALGEQDRGQSRSDSKGSQEGRDQQARNAPKRFAASELIGKEVDLADEDSFGSVEDVMLDSEGKEVVAIVVDNWSGLSKERRALKMEFDDISDERIGLRMTEEEVENIPEFDLDKYLDD